MLRELKNAHYNPLLASYEFATTGTPTVTTSIGAGDVFSISRPTAGQPVPVLKTAYTGVAPIMVGTGGTAAANGAYVTISGAQGTTTLIPGLVTSAGVATDGSMEILSFGWQSSDRNLCAPQLVKTTKNHSRVIWGKFTGATPTVDFGKKEFTIVRTAQGSYTITFLRPFARVPVITAFCVSTGGANRVARISSKSVSGCTVLVHNQTPSSADSVFYLVVVGVDSADETWGLRYPIRNSQRLPRIVAGRITYSGGVPSITVGTGDFTIADTGTGDCTITFTKPFAREPAILANSRALRTQGHTVTASSARILTYSAGAVATDPTSFDFLAIGSDDLTDY